MPTNPGSTFFRHVRKHLYPLLAEHGFADLGSRDFNRVTGEVVQAVNLQSGKYGGECFVNLGLHPLCLPLATDEVGFKAVSEPQAVTEGHCAFRLRFEPAADPGGPWAHERRHLLDLAEAPPITFERHGSWRYQTPKQPGPDPRIAAETLTQDFEAHAFDFFDRYRSLDAIAAEMPIDALERRLRHDPDKIPWGVPAVLGALAMARIEHHRGNLANAHRHAQFGLEHLGRARALEPPLRHIRDVTEGAAEDSNRSLWRRLLKRNR